MSINVTSFPVPALVCGYLEYNLGNQKQGIHFEKRNSRGSLRFRSRISGCGLFKAMLYMNDSLSLEKYHVRS
jgi:hypothetical protein